VDVHDRHVGSPGREQLERVHRRARHTHAQLVALGGVDAGVNRVRLEVERERHAPLWRVVGPASRQRQRRDHNPEKGAHRAEP
jgi:hypothetical protein